jgi:hypothetical protein
MDTAYVLSRVNTLQRELLQIAEHYRHYCTEENHSTNERAQHEEESERVCEIRAELYALIERTAA